MRSPDQRSAARDAEVWLLCGPPFAPAVYDDVAARLGHTRARSVIDPASPEDGWVERARALAASPGYGDAWLVAHGFAVPAAIAAARVAPCRGLVLLDGPLRAPTPLLRAVLGVARLPGLGRVLTAPAAVRLLASSAALRRTVTNPYALDRDTVAALCGPTFSDAPARRASFAYLRSVGRALPDPVGIPVPTWLLWGDEDPLFPAADADIVDASMGGGRRYAVPGGRWNFLVERPWVVADVVASLRDRGLLPPPLAT